ncbi:TIGR03619 family F420-dependent LLM class oxidoreductase [Phaeacidiphilus oryzae]|uniref:TIGR03619 family F420-dependent LLM class oxidoreductase n=1 Tax=Phaeacidiphilus oryzae TaxID=348818 RepID=UPI002AFEF10E|nr:TIGR03619 family F420-dependent LLM class oxidoreductase [Phaeacidiphilus oryzae]
MTETRTGTEAGTESGTEAGTEAATEAGAESVAAMRFGIQLPVQAQSRIFVEDWEGSAGPAAIAATAAHADRIGLDYVAACDHVGIPDRLAGSMGATWYDPVAVLAHCAAVTERVALVSAIAVAPLRHPLLLAKQYASLDALSAGRLILGVGAGHVEEEFAALGVDFHRRGALLTSAVGELKTALSTGRLDGLRISPRPAAVPRPPIWVGGHSAAAVRRAALHADGWLSQGNDLDSLTEMLALVRGLRPPERPFAVNAIAPPVYVGEPGWDTGRAVTGKPDRLAGLFARYRAAGATHLQIRPRSRSLDEYLDQLSALATEVLPLVPTA